MRVIRMIAIVNGCTWGHRSDNPRRRQWMQGGHQSYLLSFDAEPDTYEYGHVCIGLENIALLLYSL